MNRTIIKPGAAQSGALQSRAMQSRTNRPSKQSGMTMLSWLIIIIFLLFQAVMAMNILPAYMTDSTVKGIIEKLPDEPSVKSMSAKDVRKLILKRFRINSIYHLDGKDVVKVKKGRGETIVTVNYEPRGKLIGNLEFIISFEHEVRIASR